MKKYIIVVIIFLFTVSSVWAQRRTGLLGGRSETSGSLLLSLGSAHCQDDPYGSEFDKMFYDGNNFKIGLGYLQTLGSTHFAYRTLLQYVNLTGQDLPYKQHSRGFESYLANVFQLSGRGEYLYSFGPRFRVRKPHTIYGFTGVGTLLSSVKYPEVPGETVLKGKTTPSLAFFIPVGFGYKYDVNDQFAMGLEFCEQVVFTDMVDGYEGSHIPGVRLVNENIMSLSFTFYYKLY